MRQRTTRSQAQAMLFPPVEQCQAIPVETQREVVAALADLLLEALTVEEVVSAVKGGRDEESEDHA